MFEWLYKLLGTMLSWFSSITGSYALALLLYALVFKIVFLFFAVKQQKNQIKMAKLAPKIEIIRAKYKGRNDQVTMRKQQEEIMKLQQDEGYSPLSGCLPLLIQMPIIILLYNVIRKPLSYIAKIGDDVIAILNKHLGEGMDQITLAGRVKSLTLEANASEIASINLELMEKGLDIRVADIIEKVPSFKLWGLNLAEIPSFKEISWLVIIPFAVAGFQWLSMFITRKFGGNNMQAAAADQQTQMSMKMMDIVMPLMTLFFAFSFPAMMGIYWIYQSILGMIQSVILAKLMPIPKYTEEELKTMEKARKAAEKAQKEIIKSQPKYRSLHYIDEDDYDDLPEIKGKNNSDKKPTMSDKPEIKD